VYTLPLEVVIADLSGYWTNPDYDPGFPSCYNIRVFDFDVPVWSTYDVKNLGVDLLK
jgi:hypothetical protein